MNNRKIALICDKPNPFESILGEYLENTCVEAFSPNETAQIIPENFDLTVGINLRNLPDFNLLNVRNTLLPSFDTDEPLKDAILYGAKVTGLTFYFTKPFRILAQYPILISNDKHYDELETELSLICQSLLPIIVKKIINNEQFEIKELLNNAKNNGCGGCGENHTNGKCNSCKNCS